MNLHKENFSHKKQILDPNIIGRGERGRRNGFAKDEEARRMIHGSDIGEAIRKQRIEHRTRLTKNKERLTKRFWLWRLGNMIWEHCFGDILLEKKCGLPRRPKGTSICTVKRECRIAEPSPRVSFKDFICGSGHCERAYNMVLTRHDERIRHATNWAAPSEKAARGTQ